MASYNIDGNWRGHYSYAANPDAGSAFDASFTQDDDGLSGEIVDDMGLGTAVVTGTFSFPSVQFTKVYVTLIAAPVHYQGTMSDDGKTMNGKWNLTEGEVSLRGSWAAYRIDQASDKPAAKLRTEKEKEKVDEVY
jgi:hypothetical protein